jgi:6-phosphofructokinase 1
MVQRLAYLMRSGPPDSLDRIVANNFGSLAYDSVRQKKSGLLVSIQGGRYTTVPVSMVNEGRRQVDVDELYDATAYRPKVARVLGKPMFLY